MANFELMSEQELRERLVPYYDETGRLIKYPSKKPLRKLVLAKVAEGFTTGRDYKEKEVNEIIMERIVFSDVELIRREMVEAGMICRVRDGSRYWIEEQQK